MTIKTKRLKALFLFTMLALVSTSVQAKGVIKILAIGNSFSEDAVEQYLYELTNANGDSLVIGNAYIGGCSLETHLQNSVSNASTYSYRKVIAGKKTIVSENASLKKCITDENWDFITFQQASPLSGISASYKPLERLISFVRENATNPFVEFLFHQTWAYARNSTHDGFKNYDNDQMKMYSAIINATQLAMKDNDIKRVIPSGTAIQNARTSYIGDNFNRDGYHLDYCVGRYTVACVWLEVITGKTVVGNSFVPECLTPEKAYIVQVAAHSALLNPFKITILNNDLIAYPRVASLPDLLLRKQA